ncbi:RodZ domain-containing protein [Marinospirillum insulare]|uniref:Helix-turn-helix domain-containing protein n=1 Tax=Marinospirillum insulare TaxID=217169 RepID=A0ABQ6A1R9_9GAMM|nr:RodZ domain-containing protein [Marinospirillum insulare]GLR65247.1 helix-turn-helix domain-containing protein [Marinospirillum insulare]
MTEQQTEDQQPTETEKPVEIDCSRPGELLKKAREAKGLTQLEVAKKLNFLPVYVPALENEEFAPLHSVTFIKGYLRAYARFLGIDADEVMHCFAMHHPELAVQETQQTVEVMKPEKTTNSLFFKLFSLLILVALIAVIIVWWQSRSVEPMPSVGEQDVQVDTLDGNTIVAPVSVEEVVTPAAETVETQPTEEAIAESTVTSEPPVQAKQPAEVAKVVKPEAEKPKPTASSKPIAAAKALVGDPAAATLGNDKLVALSFQGECWVEVRDNEGSILHAALMQPGEQVLLEGEPPFRMVFGFGEAAQVFYQGQAFDFSSRIRPNGYASIRVE